MTCKTLEQQNPATEMCGVGKKVPGNLGQMMQKMLAACGSMMAEMMQESSPGEGEHTHGGETGEPPQDPTQSRTGCGCSPMMGECSKGGTSKAGEQA